jgi:alkylated DNA repair dioxygenase AlkB
MNQLGLLAGAASGVLLDDASGRFEYHEGFLEAEAAAAALHDLTQAVRWSAERREMYGREVDVPRLTASYRLDERRLPPTIAALAPRVIEAVGAPFNAVGLNLYRDGNDSVAMHNDHLYEIAAGHPIALLSLGGPRTMVIAAKRPPRRRLVLDLHPGSLLVMDHASQHHYDHGVPKQRGPVAPRISLAFRVKAPRRAS